MVLGPKESMMIILVQKQTIEDCTNALRDGFSATCPMCGTQISDIRYRMDGAVIISHYKANHSCRVHACQVLSGRGQIRTAGFIPCYPDGSLQHIEGADDHLSMEDRLA